MALTSDDTVTILKGVMYGTPKDQVPLTDTPAGSDLWDRLMAEKEAGGASFMDIPADFPDMTGVVYNKVDE